MTPDEIPIPARLFLDKLIQLKVESGRSYRTLAALTGRLETPYSKSTLQEMLNGISPLEWKDVRAFVLACHFGRPKPELGPWHRAYQRMREDLSRLRPPKRAGADTEDLAWDRDRFLSGIRLYGKPIYTDWERAGRRDYITACFDGEPCLDQPLIKYGQPIVDRLITNWSAPPVCAILATPEAVVCTRRSTDHDLEQRLDQNNLCPGFSYAEEHIATNGLGTALANLDSAYVCGPEHLAEELQDDVCAASVILDPFGDVAGIFNLTCRLKDADGLLLTIAKQTAWTISEALRADSRAA